MVQYYLDQFLVVTAKMMAALHLDHSEKLGIKAWTGLPRQAIEQYGPGGIGIPSTRLRSQC